MKRFLGFFPGLLGCRALSYGAAASEKPTGFHRLGPPQLAVETRKKNCGNAGNVSPRGF
jgi:hypothetical protein